MGYLLVGGVQHKRVLSSFNRATDLNFDLPSLGEGKLEINSRCNRGTNNGRVQKKKLKKKRKKQGDSRDYAYDCFFGVLFSFFLLAHIYQPRHC